MTQETDQNKFGFTEMHNSVTAMKKRKLLTKIQVLNQQEVLQKLFKLGFDKSHLLVEGNVVCADCSQCEVHFDSGARHQDACPNQKCPNCGHSYHENTCPAILGQCGCVKR